MSGIFPQTKTYPSPMYHSSMTRHFARFTLFAELPLLSAQPRFNEELLSALKYRTAP
jgi:hypothetical protein